MLSDEYLLMFEISMAALRAAIGFWIVKQQDGVHYDAKRVPFALRGSDLSHERLSTLAGHAMMRKDEKL